MQDKNGKVIAYSAYNPNTGNNILMKPEELSTFLAAALLAALEEALSAIPPNPPATSKIISPLFAYCPQEFNIPLIRARGKICVLALIAMVKPLKKDLKNLLPIQM
jgi:hypothetical protein